MLNLGRRSFGLVNWNAGCLDYYTITKRRCRMYENYKLADMGWPCLVSKVIYIFFYIFFYTIYACYLKFFGDSSTPWGVVCIDEVSIINVYSIILRQPATGAATETRERIFVWSFSDNILFSPHRDMWSNYAKNKCIFKRECPWMGRVRPRWHYPPSTVGYFGRKRCF